MQDVGVGLNLGFAVYAAIQAHAGKWTRYPVVGGLVWRFGAFERDSA